MHSLQIIYIIWSPYDDTTDFPSIWHWSSGAKFLNILKKQGVSGDVTTGYADRLMMSTDNSIY